ncbi:5,10-methylenetetrahydrofolate reductase, partial [Candidatus Desantisbacteria bacterium]|nr:5,10-methylenetetrahydrofolate reductase [Candidatus Desantisbacteria bacterium]
PQEFIDEMAGAEKGKALQKGMEIAARQIKQIKDEKICDGVHIMAIGQEEIVPEILEMAGM